MKLARILGTLAFVPLAVTFLSGCAMTPGGISASSTPIEGRPYTNLGRTVKNSSRVYLFGFLPVSSANTTRDALNAAVRARGGDAMINITVESYTSWWILFTKYTTRIDGDVIRFDR